MLIQFKGRGCKECPFFYNEDYNVCVISAIICEESGISEFQPNPPEPRPNGCPFKDGMEQVEVVALEH